MEVVAPVQGFHSGSATGTPYTSAPSSPMHFSVDPFELCFNYKSSPTSPAAAGETAIADDIFDFDFSLQSEKSGPLQPLTSADELFEQGKIRPLKPPPRLSPSIASHQTAKNSDSIATTTGEATTDRRRDRTVSPVFLPAISRSEDRNGSRSLSPLKGGQGKHYQTPISTPIEIISCFCRSGSSGCGDRSRKWRFKDFLLFRSASEGRATGDRSKDPLQKFRELPTSSSSSPISPKLKKGRAGEAGSRSNSFGSVESSGSARPGSARGAVSPHAMHYKAKRAAADEMKKKTALPYRQSFFNCLRFTPVIHGLTTRGFGDRFSNRGRP